MIIKLYYKDPNDRNQNYDKELTCDVSLKYHAPSKRFKFDFACQVSAIADNNNIPRDLVYKAELIDDNGNVIYDRKGLPLRVKYQSYVIDVFFPENLGNIECYHKDDDIYLLYLRGKVYWNKTENEWKEISEQDKSEVLNKLEYTQHTTCYDIDLKSIAYYPTESCNN